VRTGVRRRAILRCGGWIGHGRFPFS
jgi:hypothetical protein